MILTQGEDNLNLFIITLIHRFHSRIESTHEVSHTLSNGKMTTDPLTNTSIIFAPCAIKNSQMVSTVQPHIPMKNLTIIILNYNRI